MCETKYLKHEGGAARPIDLKSIKKYFALSTASCSFYTEGDGGAGRGYFFSGCSQTWQPFQGFCLQHHHHRSTQSYSHIIIFLLFIFQNSV